MRFGSGNAHDRRKFRRRSQRIWDTAPPRFNPGDTVRITVACYGQRYEGHRATVVKKGEGWGTYVLNSNRRKSPLVIHQDHLELVERDTKAA